MGEIQHLCDERDHAVVACNVVGVGEVDGADGDLFQVRLVHIIRKIVDTPEVDEARSKNALQVFQASNSAA